MTLDVDRSVDSSFAETFEAIRDNVATVIRGKDDVIEFLVLALVSEGHVLVEDVPGVGKTTLAKSLASSISCTFGRIQFTPDLLPADVVGVSVWNRETAAFEFRPGPIFAGLVLADEINRASPKTQSALLEAMAERQVTVDGRTHRLGRPFMVIATQNPIEHEGTYPLPESQLDRFFMKISVGYPDREAELAVLESGGSHELADELEPVVDVPGLLDMIETARSVYFSDALRRYLVDIADATRRDPRLVLGMSPRATVALQAASRARAASRGRAFVTPDDVKELLTPVVAHRLILTPEAQLQGLTAEDVLTEIVLDTPVPRGEASL
ncbi:MAG: MoxR-like ATPase [Acidimicrobiales bacterium]|nr:MAG: MoxR-like ATPase [Acidimicrobiales bacterium]